MNTLYSAMAHATGGRTGTARSDDGRLDVTLDTVKELGGSGGNGTNPEQLFAADYAACFLGPLKHVAAQKKTKLPEETTVSAAVGIGQSDDATGFALDIALSVTLPGKESAMSSAKPVASSLRSEEHTSELQ